MSDIASAMIAAVAAIIVCIINNNTIHRKIVAELEKHNAVQDERLRQLTAEVEKHNSVVERTYSLESAALLHGEQIKTLKSEIESLKGAKR